jgi:hypothetical protein
MLKRGKKAQITIFVVIAIIIVAAIAIIVVTRSGMIKPSVSKEEGEKIIASQAQPVLDTAQGCIKDTANLFFSKLGLQGGYYYISDFKTIDFAGTKVITVYKDPAGIMINRVPGTSDIESQFDFFMETEGYDYLDNCTKDFNRFKRTLDEVKQNKDSREVRVRIFDDYILINTTWTITLTRSEAINSISPNEAQLLIPLGKLTRVAQDIATKEVRGTVFMGGTVTGEYILDNAMLVRNINLEIHYYPDDAHSVVLLTSRATRVGENDYPFNFAIARV